MKYEEDYPDDEGTGSLSGYSSQTPDYSRDESSAVEPADDDVLDPAELEMLNEEAERMKGMGNKHMSSQEYTRAYNAYSAALQLSPVGPSSHVFLSNRAAALLSLKQYSAAAVDARRAVALAPTFSKAYARLGQALYFLKDYTGAVAAYEDAVKYEPENEITVSYLVRARQKLAKQEEKEQRRSRGEEVSLDTSRDSASITVTPSIATDPNAGAAVVSGIQSSSTRLRAVVGSEFKRSTTAVNSGLLPSEVKTEPMGNKADEDEVDDADPDFDEAIKLQQSATAYLSDKQYRSAVDEYSAALFLVPDDFLLSPQLHIGRAHALNGLKRHESAINDARMATKIDPDSAEAHSVLAKSLFYAKHFDEAIQAFEKSASCLEPGESVSMFDQAYLLKAKECLEEEVASRGPDYVEKKKKTAVPKLKPPRFVPREKVIISTPNIPPQPKAWPQQSLRTPPSFTIGPEREVTFYSESMGMRLNRGTDGLIRVVSVTEAKAGSPIAREGHFDLGDIVREAAGVDLRRPVTNVMWGDTVALIKISSRPITMVFAKELSPPPPSFIDELARSTTEGLNTSSVNATTQETFGHQQMALAT